MEEHVTFQYNQIEENIYLGTNACCTMHFEKELLEKGIQADISLESERIDNPKGVKFFLWLPTVDLTPTSPEQLSVGIHTIDELLNQNVKIYIHCQNGHGRAPTLLAAYYISKGESVNAAIKKIQGKRQEIHLQESQKKALHVFKEYHRRVVKGI